MKRICYLILLLLFPLSFLMAQEPAITVGSPGYLNASMPLWTTRTLPAFSLQTGAGFGAFGGGHLFSTFVSPVFSQPLGKKFTLSAGAVVENTSFGNVMMLKPSGELSRTDGSLFTTTLFGGGTYQVNDRLTLSGSAYKTINPAFNSRLEPGNLQMEAQGVSFGVGYRISDNMHIGGEIRIQQQNSNFYHPFQHPLTPVSPFRNGFYGF